MTDGSNQEGPGTDRSEARAQVTASLALISLALGEVDATQVPDGRRESERHLS